MNELAGMCILKSLKMFLKIHFSASWNSTWLTKAVKLLWYIKNIQRRTSPILYRFCVPAEKERELWLFKHFICCQCCLALLEISCQSIVSLHVCPQSISSFESYIHNSRQRNSILSEVLERVGLAGILGIMGALYRQPARITYAGLRSAWCNGREIRQTFGISLSWYPGILGNI